MWYQMCTMAGTMKKLIALGSLVLATSSLAACTQQTAEDPADSESDLTSLTARQRTLKFSGVVYVDPSSSDSMIISTIRRQTQSAFGALREANVGVNSRELKDVDPATFVKTNLTVVDAANPTGPTGKTL